MTTQSFRLVMKHGPTPGQVYELAKNEMFIGRGPTCEVVINELEVSRNHARIYLQGGEFWLEDLNSTNGTFVNGQRLIGPHLLRAGETVNLGEKVSLEVEAEYDDEATLVPPTTVPSSRAGAPEQPPTPQASYPPVPPTQQGQPAGASPLTGQGYPPAQPAQLPPLTPQQEPVFTPIEAYQPSPQQQVPEPPPVYTPPPPTQDYVEQDYEEYEEREPLNWTWVFAGCGCMTVITFILVVAALFWIDAGGEARWCQYLGFLFGAACP